MSDNRPVRYVEGGVTYYRASGLAMCDRLFVALANGYTPKNHPAWFQEVLDEGTRMESEIIAAYEAKTEQVVEGGQQRVEIEVLDDVVIVGHIDGMVNGQLFEAKKFRDSTWGKFKRNGVEAMPWYPMQVAVYMHALGVEECDFVGGWYDADKDEIKDVYVHHLSMPPVPLLGIRKRVAKLEGLINDGKFVDQVPCMEPKMYPCPMYYLHDEDDTWEPKTRPTDDIIKLAQEELDELNREFTPLNKRVEEIRARKKEINAGIAAWLEASGIDDGEEVVVGADDDGRGGRVYKRLTVYNPGYVVEPFDYVKLSSKQNPKKALKSRGHPPTTKGES